MAMMANGLYLPAKKQKFAKIQEVLTEMAESGGAAGGNCLIFRHGEE